MFRGPCPSNLWQDGVSVCVGISVTAALWHARAGEVPRLHCSVQPVCTIAFVKLIRHQRINRLGCNISCLKYSSTHVSCEFDKFWVDTHLFELRDIPAARLSYGCCEGEHQQQVVARSTRISSHRSKLLCFVCVSSNILNTYSSNTL